MKSLFTTCIIISYIGIGIGLSPNGPSAAWQIGIVGLVLAAIYKRQIAEQYGWTRPVMYSHRR